MPAWDLDGWEGDCFSYVLTWGFALGMFLGGRFVLYGPFNYGGAYTSAGNARFDQFLRAHDAAWGIRDFSALDALASAAGLTLVDDHAMPANNRLLVWNKAGR